MENKKSIIYKVATAISIVGNPLVTLSVFTLFITFKLFSVASATWISSLVIGGVAVPVAFYNYSKVKKGHITNFDLSDRQQRHDVYPRLVFMIAFVTAIFFITHQPAGFCRGSLLFFFMMLTSYLINYRLKISMHTSISFFLAFTLLKLTIPGAAFMLVFAILISLSRLMLKRHTLLEVLAGSLLGLTFGLINYWL